MAAVKVLVVDDSITMRALFTNALERSKDLVVVGAAHDAAEARDMIKELKPDVLTLDVEMPGMNGIDFLSEIMEEYPMPVIMLSTLTHKGGEVSLRALEIGAVDCFPKPQRATPDEFAKISGKLCKLVLTAAKTNVLNKRKGGKDAPAVAAPADYKWDGSLVAVSGGIGGPDAAVEMIAGFPPNCPPVILLQPLEPGLEGPFVTKLSGATTAKVVLAEDGMALEPGHIYVASDPSRHVAIDRWPEGSIRMLDRDPINGARPSADLLFATIARNAGTQSAAALLSSAGNDGAAGLGAVSGAGGRAVVQDPNTALIAEAVSAARAQNPTLPVVAPGAMAPILLAHNAMSAAA